jgi:hypothetical protein
MLTIEISHKGMGAVRVHAHNDLEQDLDLLVWPLVRRDFERLDRRVRREADALLSRIAPSPRTGED